MEVNAQTELGPVRQILVSEFSWREIYKAVPVSALLEGFIRSFKIGDIALRRIGEEVKERPDAEKFHPVNNDWLHRLMRIFTGPPLELPAREIIPWYYVTESAKTQDKVDEKMFTSLYDEQGNLLAQFQGLHITGTGTMELMVEVPQLKPPKIEQVQRIGAMTRYYDSMPYVSQMNLLGEQNQMLIERLAEKISFAFFHGAPITVSEGPMPQMEQGQQGGGFLGGIGKLSKNQKMALIVMGVIAIGVVAVLALTRLPFGTYGSGLGSVPEATVISYNPQLNTATMEFQPVGVGYGVNINLYKGSLYIGTETTGTNGFVEFQNVPPGEYTWSTSDNSAVGVIDVVISGAIPTTTSTSSSPVSPGPVGVILPYVR
jgi:hypothetical protein